MISLGKFEGGTALSEQTLSCLFDLTSLHALGLHFYCDAAVPTEITRLSRLTALTIKGVELVPTLVSVSFHADCAKFGQLQVLHLGRMVIQFAQNVLGLTTIQTLSQVSLCQLQCHNLLVTKYLCILLAVCLGFVRVSKCILLMMKQHPLHTSSMSGKICRQNKTL